MKMLTETRKLIFSLQLITDNLFQPLNRHYLYRRPHYINARYSSENIPSRIHNDYIPMHNSYKLPFYHILNTFGGNYNITDRKNCIHCIVPRASHPHKIHNTFENNVGILSFLAHNRILHISLSNPRTLTLLVT